MTTSLIEAEPRYTFQLDVGWLFQFGEMVVEQRFSMVYLIQPTPYYRIYKTTLDETGQPVAVLERERELTPEEIAHFTRLAKEQDRKFKKADTQARRQQLFQQKQSAIADATNGRVLM